jgi:hypothetical protein
MLEFVNNEFMQKYRRFEFTKSWDALRDSKNYRNYDNIDDVMTQLSEASFMDHLKMF